MHRQYLRAVYIAKIFHKVKYTSEKGNKNSQIGNVFPTSPCTFFIHFFRFCVNRLLEKFHKNYLLIVNLRGKGKCFMLEYNAVLNKTREKRQRDNLQLFLLANTVARNRYAEYTDIMVKHGFTKAMCIQMRDKISITESVDDNGIFHGAEIKKFSDSEKAFLDDCVTVYENEHLLRSNRKGRTKKSQYVINVSASLRERIANL